MIIETHFMLSDPFISQQVNYRLLTWMMTFPVYLPFR